MSQIHFIVNPFRPSIGLRWPYEENKIEALTKDFVVHLSRGKMHSEILTRQAIEDGAKLLVCVGGDSTLSEIVNGLYRASRGNREVPKLTFYPGLQQGDAVRSFDLRSHFVDYLEAYFANQAIDEKVDLGEIEFTGEFGQKMRRVFLNSAGFGFSAALAQKLSGNYKIKRNQFGFLRLLLRHVPFFPHPSVEISIDHGVPFTEDILTGLVHNGRFLGRGIEVSPLSKTNDGVFEFNLVLKTYGYRYILGSVALYSGKMRKASFVRHFSCKHLSLKPALTGKKIRLDFDGDAWGFLPAQISVREGALLISR